MSDLANTFFTAGRGGPVSLSPPLVALGLTLTLGLPAIGLYRRQWGDTDLDWSDLRRGHLRTWMLFAAVVVLVGVAGRPADLALRIPDVGTIVDGLLFGFVAFAGTMVLVGLSLRVTGGLTLDVASRVVFEQPLPRRLAVAVTNTTVESVLFYGFAIEALHGFGIELWYAGVISSVGVLLARAQWGARHAMQWVPGTLVLAGIAVWTRTSLVVFAVRLVYDVVVSTSADASDYDFIDRPG